MPDSLPSLPLAFSTLNCTIKSEDVYIDEEEEMVEYLNII